MRFSKWIHNFVPDLFGELLDLLRASWWVLLQTLRALQNRCMNTEINLIMGLLQVICSTRSYLGASSAKGGEYIINLNKPWVQPSGDTERALSAQQQPDFWRSVRMFPTLRLSALLGWYLEPLQVNSADPAFDESIRSTSIFVFFLRITASYLFDWRPLTSSELLLWNFSNFMIISDLFRILLIFLEPVSLFKSNEIISQI